MCAGARARRGQAARIAGRLHELNCARYLVGYRSPRQPGLSQLRALRKQLGFSPCTMADFFAWTGPTACSGPDAGAGAKPR